MQKNYIYWVNLDPTVGAEISKTRPCVIISPDEMNRHLKTVIIVPITTKCHAIPTRIGIKATAKNGLTEDSFAVLDQISTIDKSRIKGPAIGALTAEEAQQLDRKSVV